MQPKNREDHKKGGEEGQVGPERKPSPVDNEVDGTDKRRVKGDVGVRNGAAWEVAGKDGRSQIWRHS